MIIALILFFIIFEVIFWGGMWLLDLIYFSDMNLFLNANLFFITLSLMLAIPIFILLFIASKF